MKRLLVFLVPLVVLAAVAGCGGDPTPTPTPTPTPPPPLQPQPRTAELLAAVQMWVATGLPELAGDITDQVTGDIPLAGSAVESAVRLALEADVQWRVENVRRTGDNSVGADVIISLPFEVDLLLTERKYVVDFVYFVEVTADEVVVANLDLSSIALRGV